MCILFLFRLAIGAALTFGAFGQPGQRNVCPNDQPEPQCGTEWTKWTSCLPPETSIEKGVKDFKEEIEHMRCEVPIWFWQATLESKMMQYRKNLKNYRDENGLGPQRIVVRRRIKPKVKTTTERGGDGDKNGKDDDDDDDKDEDKKNMDRCFEDEEEQKTFKKLHKQRAAMMFWCKEQSKTADTPMSPVLHQMLIRMKQDEVDDYYYYMMKKDKDDEKDKDENNKPSENGGGSSWGVIPSTDFLKPLLNTKKSTKSLRDAEPEAIDYENEMGKAQSKWMEKLMAMDDGQRMRIEQLLGQWKQKVLESMVVYQELTEMVWFKGGAQAIRNSATPPTWVAEKLGRIDQLNKEAHQLLSQAEALGLTHTEDFKKLNQSPCDKDESDSNGDDKSHEAGDSNEVEMVDPTDPLMCPNLQKFLMMEQKVMSRCTFKPKKECKRSPEMPASIVERANPLVARCKTELASKKMELGDDFYKFAARLEEEMKARPRRKRQTVQNTTAPPISDELKAALSAYHGAARKGLALSLEIMIISRMNISLYREMASSDPPYEPPVWLQQKMMALEVQMDLVDELSTSLNEFAETSVMKNGGMDSFDVCKFSTKRNQTAGMACATLKGIAREFKAFKNASGLFPKDMTEVQKNQFMSLKQESPKLIFHCKHELLNGKVMPMKFYEMMEKHEMGKGNCKDSKSNKGSTKQNAIISVLPDPNKASTVPEMKELTDEQSAQLRSLMQDWKKQTVDLFNLTIGFSVKLLGDARARKDIADASANSSADWVTKHFKEVEANKGRGEKSFAEIQRIQPAAAEQLSMMSPCGGHPSRDGGNVVKSNVWASLTGNDKKAIGPDISPEKRGGGGEGGACEALMRFFTLNKAVKEHEKGCKKGKGGGGPGGGGGDDRRRRRKRQALVPVVEEDADEFEFDQIEVTTPPTAGCGFCARRIRCCKDKYFSWIDQQLESEICEEYSSACEVQPLADGTCDYAAAMPRLVDDEMTYNGNAKNRKLADKLKERVEDKWLQSLGSTAPAMHCTKHEGTCHCCCGDHKAQLNPLGNMTCRKFKAPKK